MDITELRSKIDEIDDKISDLFVERMEVSADIGAYKLDSGMNIRDAGREKEIIDKLCKKVGDVYAPYLGALYTQILEMSRRYQSYMQLIGQIEYGLIGKDVSSSYSKWIHHSLGNQSFGLYSLPFEMLALLFRKRSFKGLCVSGYYKREMAQYCDKLDRIAKNTGCVNTVVREDDGSVSGYNTEYDGFLTSMEKAGIDLKNKKIMLLGSSPIAASIREALQDRHPSEILNVTRTGKINFRNYSDHKDTDIVINATKIGMTPDEGASPVDLSVFSNVSAVIDCIYTPVETLLISKAKSLGIPHVDGLKIMIASAMKSSELFGFVPEKGVGEELYEELLSFII